jgi:hypothetical protein
VNHARHAIREALVAALAAGGTAASTRVYDHPNDVRVTFPAIVVTDLSERQSTPTLPGGSARMVERVMDIEVTAELQQIGTYARARDQLVADVERIAVTATLPGAKYIVPVGYVADQDTSGERPIVIGRQRFEIFYVTTQGDPATTL